jgi:hypothetical protein
MYFSWLYKVPVKNWLRGRSSRCFLEHWCNRWCFFLLSCCDCWCFNFRWCHCSLWLSSVTLLCWFLFGYGLALVRLQLSLYAHHSYQMKITFPVRPLCYFITLWQLYNYFRAQCKCQIWLEYESILSLLSY